MRVQAKITIINAGVEVALDVTGDVERNSVTVGEVYYPGTATRWPGELTDSELGDAQDALREEAQWE